MAWLPAKFFLPILCIFFCGLCGCGCSTAASSTADRATGVAPAADPGAAAPAPPDDALAGTLHDDAGRPVAGAWVTAIADAGPTHVRRTVVTDASGAWRIDGLTPRASHRVRTRAYGFADLLVRHVTPGRALALRYHGGDVLDAAETAAQYPSSYWLSLLEPPGDLGADAKAPTPADWTTNVIYNCAHCHQPGTRQMRAPRTREQWAETFRLAARMEQSVQRLGRDRVVDLFTRWSDRIRGGALPVVAPERPTGEAARYRLTEWDVGSQLSWFREIAAGNAWSATTGAAPPKGASGKWVYTADVAWGTLVGVNVDSGERREWSIPVRGKLVWPYGSWDLFRMTSAPITLQVDQQGRVVIVAFVRDDTPPGVLTHGVASVLPLLPPDAGGGRKWGGNHQLLIFDPRAETWDPVVTPCDTHAVTVAKDGRYWLTRQEDKICSYDPATKRADSYAWPADWGKGIVGGNDVSSDDKVYFFFSFTFGKQDSIAMYDARAKSFHRFPIPAPARLPRHLCMDSQDRPYVLLQSGHLGRLDAKTGQFALWPLPESRLGSAGDGHGGFSVNLGFSCVVDKEGNAGTKDGVYISGNLSDSIILFDPAREQFTSYRIPNHFYTKDLEIFDGGVWALLAENPEKYMEPDPVTQLAQPRLVRLDRWTK